MASDMVDEDGRLIGNSISLLLNCNSEDEIQECYSKLSAGGEQTHQLEITFWVALFGNR
jgi:PhnB protein